MDIHTIAPALEAGLNALRDAGLAGMSPMRADNLAVEILDAEWKRADLSADELDEAATVWWAVTGNELLTAAYEEGIREFEAQDAAPYRATIIFEELAAAATRADFIGALLDALPALSPIFAERTVDRVVRARTRKPTLPQYGPHPTDIFALVAQTEPTPEQIGQRRMALSMYLEKRAARPKHDLLPAASQKPGQSVSADDREELEALRELDRLRLARQESLAPHRQKGGLLRTVNYNPGAIHTAPTWLVKGLFPDRGLGMLVGESQSGKSFLAIHAAVSIARGEPFFGRKVKPGGVLYIAAEGGSSVLPRIKAADEAIGGTLADGHLVRRGKGTMSRAPIKVMTETPNLSRDGDPAALARTLRALHHELADTDYPLTFVVVDTWHASLCGGDEQSAADAGHALKPLREAVEELGLFVLIVHHPGKDIERGARGSSALRAAVDTEIELRVPGAEGPKAKPAAIARRVTLTKQRDGAVGEEFHYRLNTVQLGRDEDGDPWTTCTVVPCEAPAGATGDPKGKGDVRLRRAVESALADCGQERAEIRVVRGYFNNAGPADEKDDARRKAFSRALDKAREAGTFKTDPCDQWVCFSKSARDTGQMDTP